MNLPVIFSNLARSARKVGGVGLLMAKKHGDKICLGGGAISFFVTIFETVKATNESHEILEAKDHRMDLIENEVKENPSYTTDIFLADKRNINRDTKISLVRVWIKPGVSAIFTLLLFGSAYRIVNGKLAGMTMAYETLDQFTKRYRKNVVDEYGADVDWRLAHNLKAEEVAELRKNQAKAAEQQKKNRLLPPRTQYEDGNNNQIFDKSSSKWQSYWLPQQAIDFVTNVESRLQDLVEMQGFALLNDAYKMLGEPPTSQGCIVGWIKTPSNKHVDRGTKVSLGFANGETPREEIERICASPSNEDIYIWLAPNCDGRVDRLIDVPFHRRDEAIKVMGI